MSNRIILPDIHPPVKKDVENRLKHVENQTPPALAEIQSSTFVVAGLQATAVDTWMDVTASHVAFQLGSPQRIAIYSSLSWYQSDDPSNISGPYTNIASLRHELSDGTGFSAATFNQRNTGIASHDRWSLIDLGVGSYTVRLVWAVDTTTGTDLNVATGSIIHVFAVG